MPLLRIEFPKKARVHPNDNSFLDEDKIELILDFLNQIRTHLNCPHLVFAIFLRMSIGLRPILRDSSGRAKHALTLKMKGENETKYSANLFALRILVSLRRIVHHLVKQIIRRFDRFPGHFFFSLV